MNTRTFYNIVKSAHDEIPYRLPGGWAFRPLKVVWELTYKCNLKCEMCYLVHEGRDKLLKELTTEEVKSVIDRFGRVFPIITYTGGEPLVRSDIMEILHYTKRKNMCGILSNGVMITDEIARQLVEMGLDSVTISIDGPEELHDRIRNMKGCYEKAVGGLRFLQKWKKELNRVKPLLHINTVILPSNVKQLHHTVGLASELGLDSCSFQALDPSICRSGLNIEGNDFMKYKKPTIFDVDRIDPETLRTEIRKTKEAGRKLDVRVKFVPGTFSEEDFVNYYSQKIDYSRCGCMLPWNLMYISPSGEVYPCYNYRIGNVRDERIGRLWNNRSYRKFRVELKRLGIFPGCVGCCNMIYRSKK